MTRLQSERYHDDCIQHTFHSGRASVGVWRAMIYNWKSELVFLKPTGKKGITCNDYLEQVLKPVVGPAFQGQKGYKKGDAGGLYVEDGAPWHGVKKVLRESKKELGIPRHDRLAQSPDLNPIENVWRIMKQRIKARTYFPGTVNEMRKAVQQEWARLRPVDFNQFVDSMPERIVELQKRAGMQTRW